MGYGHGCENYAEWFWRKYPESAYPHCAHCGTVFLPKSPTQKYCDDDSDDYPACRDDRYFESLWKKGKHPLQLIDRDKSKNK